jgi:hypothetical protein
MRLRVAAPDQQPAVAVMKEDLDIDDELRIRRGQGGPGSRR